MFYIENCFSLEFHKNLLFVFFIFIFWFSWLLPEWNFSPHRKQNWFFVYFLLGDVFLFNTTLSIELDPTNISSSINFGFKFFQLPLACPSIEKKNSSEKETRNFQNCSNIFPILVWNSRVRGWKLTLSLEAVKIDVFHHTTTWNID